MNQDNIDPKRFIYEQLQNMLTYCLNYKKKTENVNSKLKLVKQRYHQDF